MKNRWAAGWMCLGLMAGAAFAQAPLALDRLDWLSGTWVSEQDGRWSEELWTAPRGGLMLGLNRAGKDGAARGFDFMRIQAGSDGVLTYWASPNGKPAVPFRLSASTDDSVTFENPEHDFPTRIVYRREGDRLVATISGPGGAQPMRWTWQRR